MFIDLYRGKCLAFDSDTSVENLQMQKAILRMAFLKSGLIFIVF